MAPEQAPAGEQALIDRILARLGTQAATDIPVPPGDDAAAWYAERPITVATTDALVAGAHWRADTMTLADVGWRAVASNVSDLAAMGAHPRFLLIALVAAPDLKPEDLDLLASGIAESCRAHDVRVAGGDLVRHPADGAHGGVAMLSITALGEAHSDRPLLRRDALRPGDTVAVSGPLGAAGAGLLACERGLADDPRAAALLAAHRRPQARTETGLRARASGLLAACDISDGLARDLGHIARRSGVGIEVPLARVPVSPEAAALFDAETALACALGGGEDYELILGGPDRALAALTALADDGAIPGPPITIGRAVAAHPGEVWFLDAAGERAIPAAVGWDPFAANGGGEAP